MNVEKLNLTWHTYTDHLKEMLHNMMSSNEFTDVTLVSEGCNPDFPRSDLPSKKITLDPDYPLGIKKSYISEVYEVSLDSSHQEESEYVKIFHNFFQFQKIIN